MTDLTLDEYRLMLGTQLWLKESIFEFIEALLGGINSGSQNNDYSNNDLLKMTEKLENKTRKRAKVSKIDELKADTSMREDLSKIRKNFNDLINKNSDKSKEDKVDLSDCTLLIHDNSHKRDDKEDALMNKLKHYKSKGYLK